MSRWEYAEMYILDNALRAREAQGNPIRVGLIGAGFMARGLTNQIVNSFVGMRLVAIYNRHVEKALRAYEEAGMEPVEVTTQAALEDAIRAGKHAVSADWSLLDALGADRYPGRRNGRRGVRMSRRA